MSVTVEVQTCFACHGKQRNGFDRCPTCNGAGRLVTCLGGGEGCAETIPALEEELEEGAYCAACRAELDRPESLSLARVAKDAGIKVSSAKKFMRALMGLAKSDRETLLGDAERAFIRELSAELRARRVSK